MRLVLLLLVLSGAAAVSAHPLGNNTVNRAAALVINGAQIRIDYQLDFAEIPTLLATDNADRDSDGRLSEQEWQAYTRDWSRALIPALHLSADNTPLVLSVATVEWQLLPAAAGLSQLRLRGVFEAAAPAAGRVKLRYEDRSRPEDIGWREVWVSAESGARIVTSTAARADRSAALTQFPTATGALLQETTAELEAEFFGPGHAASAHPAPVVQTDVQTQAAGPLALFLLGMHHIASGWDHLVFLLGLLLLCRSLPRLLAVVSAFTVAHSVTLGLAAAGLVTPPGALVEAAIALSIAYVGLCNVYQRQHAHGVALALGFGLLHGFGFAGALAASLGEQGLEGHSWLLSLAAFNLGIETFQIALLCILVPLATWAARWSWGALAQRGASHAVLWAGLGWFVQRVA
jgi:hypothetical protein